MKSFFKTKHNYHDANIIGYKWEGDDLVLIIDPVYPSTPSEVRFSGVKSKDKIEQDLFRRDFRRPNRNIYGIEKTGKKEFTVHVSEPIKVICDSIIEV
jgi:hypothetical protein